MPPSVISAVVSGAVCLLVGAGGAWKWQEVKILNIQLVAKNERIAIQQKARTDIIRVTDNLAKAQNEAAARSAELRAFAAASAAQLGSLQQQSDIALRTATASPDACANTAATFSRLLNQCAERYQELGAVCARHVSDIKTLMSGWPKGQ